MVVCAGYQKLDSLQDLDFEDLDKHWQVRPRLGLAASLALNDTAVVAPARSLRDCLYPAGLQGPTWC